MVEKEQLPELEKEKIGQDPDEERADDFSPIQLQSKDEEAQKKVVEHISSLFDEYDSWRKPYERLWEEIYSLYFTSQSRMKTPTRSSVTVPIVFQVIEAAVPKIVNTLFGSGEEFFDVIPENPQEDEFADAILTLLTYQLYQADFMVKFIDFCKQLLMYGTSYFHVYWKTKRKWVVTRTPVRKQVTINGFDLGESIEWIESKEYRVVERRPEVEVLDILDVFPQPDIPNEKEGKGFFVRSWMELDDVKAMGKGKFPIFANTDDSKLQKDADSYGESRQTRFASRGVSRGPASQKNQVEILTFWGNYDIDGDGIKEEAQIVIANKQVLLIARANPFHHQKRPVVRTVFFPVPLEWYGMGLVEPVISNVHELWTLRRQRMDNINLAINRMWKVSTLADIDLDTLVSTPSGIILTDQMDGVIPLDSNDVTASAYNEAAMVQADIENATAPRSVQGTPESGRLGRTARGAQLIIGQALEKFAVGAKLIEEMGIKRVIRMFHQLNLQFIDNDDVFRDPGLYGHLFDKVITVEQIRAEVRFRMVGLSDMIGTEGKINQLTSFLGIAAQFLDPTSIDSILKKIAKLMNLDPNEIQIQGTANPQGQMNPHVVQSILGQVQNQGMQAGPPQAPLAPL